MSANPNRVRLSNLTRQQEGSAPLVQPLPPGARSPILPAGVARENSRKLQNLEERVETLESVPTVPGSLTQSVSQLSGTVASIRQAVEANIRTLGTLQTQVSATQRDLNTFRGQIDSRIDGRVDPKLNEITRSGGTIDQKVQSGIQSFAQPNGPLDAQIDQKLGVFPSSQPFKNAVRGELSGEIAGISRNSTEITNLQGKLQNRDQPAFSSAAGDVRGAFSGAATNLSAKNSQIQGLDSGLGTRRSNIVARRNTIQKAINGDFGTTGAFGFPDAKKIAEELLTLLDNITGVIDNIRATNALVRGGLTDAQNTFSVSAPKFATMGSNV